MSLVLGFDAAVCPDPVPASIAGEPVVWCEFYMGGSSATDPNGWSPGEMERVQHLKKLPVWVPTPGFDNPRQSALACIAACKKFGVPAWATPYKAVMWDLETGREPDQGWLAIARSYMLGAGYDTLVYGSTAWVFGYDPYSGYIPADWTGEPHLYVHPGVVGTQYAANVSVLGGVVDLDMLDSVRLAHLVD